MNGLWWNQIRMQLGLSWLNTQEAIDQYAAMSCGEIEDWLFRVQYGQIEKENVHSFSDKDWWLSSISI